MVTKKPMLWLPLFYLDKHSHARTLLILLCVWRTLLQLSHVSVQDFVNEKDSRGPNAILALHHTSASVGKLQIHMQQTQFTAFRRWKEKMLFAGDQLQFAINHPRQQPLLKPTEHFLIYSFPKIITFTQCFISRLRKRYLFHIQRCLSNCCSTSLLIWSLSRKSLLVPSNNVTFWHLKGYLTLLL